MPLDGAPRAEGFVHPTARVSEGALLDGHFYVGPGCEVEAGARLGPDAVLVADVRVRAGATCATASCGGASRPGPDCEVQGSLIGPGVRLGRSSVLRNAVLGEGSVVSDYSRTL